MSQTSPFIRATMELISEKFGIDSWRAREAAEAVRAARPAITASDLEIGILWEAMAERSAASWLFVDEHTVERFLLEHGDALESASI